MLVVVVDPRDLASGTSFDVVKEEGQENKVVVEVLQQGLVVGILLVDLKGLRANIVSGHLRVLDPQLPHEVRSQVLDLHGVSSKQ